MKSKYKRNQKNILSAHLYICYIDIFVELGKIESYISESNKELTEESTKKSLIDDLSKRLLK